MARTPTVTPSNPTAMAAASPSAVLRAQMSPLNRARSAFTT